MRCISWYPGCDASSAGNSHAESPIRPLWICPLRTVLARRKRRHDAAALSCLGVAQFRQVQAANASTFSPSQFCAGRKLVEQITARDAEVLQYLEDVRHLCKTDTLTVA